METLLALALAASLSKPVPVQAEIITVASWYGKGFHGRKTASGERYNQNALTAAHRTLPLGTVVEVTRLDTGKSIQVRISDRGPFKRGRGIDLSLAAARKIDMVRKGTARVKLTVVKKGK